MVTPARSSAMTGSSGSVRPHSGHANGFRIMACPFWMVFGLICIFSKDMKNVLPCT